MTKELNHHELLKNQTTMNPQKIRKGSSFKAIQESKKKYKLTWKSSRTSSRLKSSWITKRRLIEKNRKGQCVQDFFKESTFFCPTWLGLYRPAQRGHTKASIRLDNSSVTRRGQEPKEHSPATMGRRAPEPPLVHVHAAIGPGLQISRPLIFRSLFKRIQIIKPLKLHVKYIY